MGARYCLRIECSPRRIEVLRDPALILAPTPFVRLRIELNVLRCEPLKAVHAARLAHRFELSNALREGGINYAHVARAHERDFEDNFIGALARARVVESGPSTRRTFFLTALPSRFRVRSWP